MGMGAVRLNAFWGSAPKGPRYSFPPSDVWFASGVGPGKTAMREFPVRAPNTSGRFRLCVELSQNFHGPFSRRGVAPLCAETEVLPGEARPGESHAVEWGDGSGPAELIEGEEATYSVSVRNLSGDALRRASAVAYHWRQTDGPNVFWEGIRTPLPKMVEPDETVRVSAKVKANVPPGTYALEFDLVSDLWFEWAGSPPLVLEVRVRGKAP
jgi:hypothetical protein